ncbi:HsdR family type I site-specific deoxyribonuclease [Streptococcus suis]|uniref:type I restriction endonuclease subunit R n=1 Tax=Streptococcus suis TaxID=1307 RepID=UPI0037D5164A
MNELAFETELIQYITTGTITQPEHLEGLEWSVSDSSTLYAVKSKLWTYEPGIKTTEQLWENFRNILWQHNQHRLDKPLSDTEFAQVKQIISDLKTPYEAGQFLYGISGVSELEITLDDGRHTFLTVFDQRKIGGGDTVYQVVNQIRRAPKIPGRRECIFDTTLLINGLPIIQIEEKKDTVDVDKALNQMHQYIQERQYTDIFSTLQILVAIAPNNVRYMANTTAEKFNKDFAFHWQRKSDGSKVRNWKEFADSMLSIPMAHQMATNYMILDGTPQKQMLKVMRPYQVYATQAVIEGIKKVDFELGCNKVGYIWHTTGSGKTITSFKTAWLASRMPKVDKVVFLVDRIALTNQTKDDYLAYDPEAGENSFGSIRETQNTTALARQLTSKDSGIIVTSVQKLDTLVKRKSFKSPDKHIVFIVDEAHRSTGGDSFAGIQKAFKKAAWIGYTGTPNLDDTGASLRTQDIFGPLLHAYTIKNAISDRNVLGFKVDFETTIDQEKLKTTYLPDFYRQKYPKWTSAQIEEKIANLSPDDMDDAVTSSVYDENPEHVRLVVEDVFKHWANRSGSGRYNALFTTHVGGGRASTPMAMMYFREFQRINQLHREQGGLVLKVGVTFALNTQNNDSMVESNTGLLEAITIYNTEFGTSFGLSDVAAYTEDLVSRLNRTAKDKNYLDLVIVVDQLLTGFNAPELNTLYVDRTLKGASLIQAYSRTNRVEDMDKKPFGRVVNYRWPAHNEKLMNQALAIYADDSAANLSEAEQKNNNEKNGLVAKPFKDVFAEVKQTVDQLRELTGDFNDIPKSEKKCEAMLELLRAYNQGLSKLKQYQPEEVDGVLEGFDYNQPDRFIESLGMSVEEEKLLTTVLANELKRTLAKEQKVSIHQIELKMTHIKEVTIDYDKLTELVELLLNQVHEEKMVEAAATRDELDRFASGLEDLNYADQIRQTGDAIYRGDFPTQDMNFAYPVKGIDSQKIIQEASHVYIDKKLFAFRIQWGLTEHIRNQELRELLARHRYGQNDLDDTGHLRTLIKEASRDYQTWAEDDAVKGLSKIQYRNQLRQALYDLADNLVGQ